MQKVSLRQRFMLTLPRLLLLAAFLIVGGIEALISGTPTAHAAQTDQSRSLEGTEHRGLDSGCQGTQRKPNFGGVVEVSRGEVVCGDVTSFGGQVVIHGEVIGDVVAFGGNVIVDGVVDGNISLYGGNLFTPDRAHVNGDIHVCGGNWTEGDGMQLHGSVFHCTGGLDMLLGNNAGVQLRFWYIITWVMLGIVLTTLLPEHVMLVRTTAKSKLRRSLALGLLSMLLAPIILAVLIALIIAIPFAILVAVGFIAAWALGTVSVGWIVGDMIVQRIAPNQNTRMVQIVVGLAVLAFLGSLPYIGWIISLLVGMIGLGAVFLSRFGTRLYGQPKRPITW
ncbi:hypothetical protein ccbrp13_40010 [Ktedonobacteria bacterium brp13]|nr:hypothetical protein ccbrp13_40010 [Ktedonobacteria bacterium brp13]